jgi:2-amino-4-hydroxy-6-hydroxymethyldihydropteridine diphosphokinase
MSSVVIAYIGLGSNLVAPVSQVQTAITELAGIRQSRLLKSSSLYQTAPLGPAGQPDYINAVAALQTPLSADELLTELQKLENRHQRVRRERWGPRTLDLDLLLYGDEVINSERLTVPHPGLSERNFVLIPLREIAPDLILPDNQALAELAQRCSRDGLQRLEVTDKE